MQIRLMSIADCDGLEALFAEVPGNVEPRAELERPITRAWIARASEPGAIWGYLLAWWIIDEIELLAVATLPEVRRQGVARALLATLVDAARAGGARRITLEVARGNVAALRLYESQGFRLFNVRRGYYRKTGEDALEMELVLGAD